MGAELLLGRQMQQIQIPRNPLPEILKRILSQWGAGAKSFGHRPCATLPLSNDASGIVMFRFFFVLALLGLLKVNKIFKIYDIQL